MGPCDSFGSLFVTAIIILSLNLFQTSSLPKIPFLSYYESLNYPPNILEGQHKRVRRSVSNSVSSQWPIKLPIRVYQHDLQLVLYPDTDVISHSSQLVVAGKKWPGGLPAVANNMVKGYIEGHPESLAFGSILSGIFRGTISLRVDDFTSSQSKEPPYGTFYVEPSGNFFDREVGFHSVVYHASHVKSQNFFNNTKKRFRRDAVTDPIRFCGLSNPTIAKKMSESRNPIHDSSKSYSEFLIFLNSLL